MSPVQREVEKSSFQLKNLKGTWGQALRALLLPIFILLTIRWLLFEPYVIPSGSMIPTLLVHDYVLVNKLAYGLRLPFTDIWLYQNTPKRGEVVVFRSPRERETFFIKRVIGLPGESVRIQDGIVYVDERPLKLTFSHYDSIQSIGVFKELIQGHEHQVQYHGGERPSTEFEEYIVPEDSIFVMGDNRDESHDSRFWGALRIQKLIGRASGIWLSCENMLPGSSFLCDPKTIRKDRLFKRIN